MKDFLSFLKKTKNPDFYFLFAPLVFATVLLFVVFANKILEIKIQSESNHAFSLSFGHQSQYPFLNFNGQELGFSNITAEAFVVMDDDSKVVIFSKNSNLRFSMASTVKIMTALTALEYYRMDDILTVKTDNVESVVVGFKKGERVYFESLLYAMLLPSGNDAALAIAQNYKGGEIEFINQMNKNALKYHLLNTHFSDSIGLNDEGDYTTAVDLARLSSVALKNKTFSQIVSTKSKPITNIDGTNTYSLYNLNKLLGVDGVNGIKTGFTDEAGGVLVTSKTEDNHTFIIIVMKSQDRFLDTQKLLSAINGNIAFLKFDY